MIRIIYILAFIVVAVSTILPWVKYLFFQIDIRISYGLFEIFLRYNNPIPILLSQFIPKLIIYISYYVFLFLIVRRIFLFIAKRELPLPIKHSLIAYPIYLFLFLTFLSFLLGTLALLTTIFLKAGSGVPAGLIMIPSMLMPTVIFLVELYSLFIKSKHILLKEQ